MGLFHSGALDQDLWKWIMITHRGLDRRKNDKAGWSRLNIDLKRKFDDEEVAEWTGTPSRNPVHRFWFAKGNSERHPTENGYTQQQFDELKAWFLAEAGEGDADVERSDIEMTILNDRFVYEYAEKIEEMKRRTGEDVLLPRNWMTKKKDKDGNLLPDDQQTGMWWFELLDPLGKALVKSVDTWKRVGTSTVYVKILAHLESKGLCIENEVEWKAFLARLGDSETVFTKDSYVTRRLLDAAGVPQSSVPLTKRVPYPKEKFVAYAEALFDECDFNGELNVLTELQCGMVNVALQNLDLVELYWLATNPNPAYAYLMKFLHDIFPCDCASCKRKLFSVMLCQLDHIDREIKKEFTRSSGRVKEPAQNSANELWEQFVAGALQILCQEAHRNKDHSKLALILANVIANEKPSGGPLYSQRVLNNHKYLNAIDEELYEGRCLFSGKFFTPQTIYTDEGEVVIPPETTAHRDRHHISGEDDVVGQDSTDGSETLHNTAKKEGISIIANRSNSNADFQERIKELLKVRPANCIEHDVFHYIIERPDLLRILCVVIPWERRPAVKDANGKVLQPGQIVVPSAWQEELPSILEPEIASGSKDTARVVREQRLCDFFAEIGHDAGAENPFAHHLVEGEDLHDFDFGELLAKMQSNVEVDESDDESVESNGDSSAASSDVNDDDAMAGEDGASNVAKFDGAESDGSDDDALSPSPAAIASSDGQLTVEPPTSESCNASVLEKASSDSMDVESLHRGNVSFQELSPSSAVIVQYLEYLMV